MRVLVIKTSSMGDVIHTLPALTDASRVIPDIIFDWVVEPAFAEIPHWHPQVERVIPFAFRQWRRQPYQAIKQGEWRDFRRALAKQSYDYVIDAQGLLKSAWVACLAHGQSHGFSWHSAREPLASTFYQRRHRISRTQHAVHRVRQLFAGALNYSISNERVDYGIAMPFSIKIAGKQPYCVFLHATTWATKRWPTEYWRELIRHMQPTGLRVKLPWGNEQEQRDAQALAAGFSHVDVLPQLNLTALADVLGGAQAVVAVDTGLGHLAAALEVPTISLYAATDPERTGTCGQHQIHVSARYSCAPCLQEQCTNRCARKIEPPCFSTVTPAHVWKKLQPCLEIITEPA